MIITVSMNPCIDRTISVNSFNYGGMNRVASARDDACGKAVNLSIVTSVLGERVCCVGLLPKDNGIVVEARLNSAGVQTRFTSTPGRLRVNIKLLDESRGVITEINERGSSVSAEDLAGVEQVLDGIISGGDYLVITGSMPPGCPAGFYGKLIARYGTKARCVLDCDGEALRLGLKEKPFLIKPNIDELSQLSGEEYGSLEDIIRAARGIRSRGVENVVVTLGKDGAALISGEGEFYAPGLELAVRSTVGAGDSMIAGMLCGLARGLSAPEWFKMGAAAAASSVQTEGTQLVDFDMYARMSELITIQRL